MTDVNPLLTIKTANADEAYERTLTRALALDRNVLSPITVDVMGVVLTSMGVAKKLPGFEAELATLQQFPQTTLTTFPDEILALFTAQSRYSFATTPVELLPELSEKASRSLSILTTEYKSLVAREVLDGELLKELTGVHGYKNVTVDLAGMTSVFKSAWSTIEGHTGLKYADVLEMDKLALLHGGRGCGAGPVTGKGGRSDGHSPAHVHLAHAFLRPKFAAPFSFYGGMKDDADDIVPLPLRRTAKLEHCQEEPRRTEHTNDTHHTNGLGNVYPRDFLRGHQQGSDWLS